MSPWFCNLVYNSETHWQASSGLMEFGGTKPFTSYASITTHYGFTFLQDFHKWMGSLKHVSVMKCHILLLHTNCRFRYTVHYHTRHFSVTFLGVISQFMRWLHQRVGHNYFMAILEVKDMKAHSVFNTCSQLYPLASLTRFISMGNVYMKTKRKARYWKNITIMFIFWPFFQAC